MKEEGYMKYCKIGTITLLFWCCILSVAAKSPRIVKNINYVDSSASDFNKDAHVLDVYLPLRKIKESKVFVFIHGGAWQKGTKDSPRHIAVGKAFSNNGMVVVVINYRIQSGTKYYDMASDCARAITWVENNIAQYGGNKNEIYVSGHSSGAHLAALVSTDSTYLMNAGFQNSIKGCILNDPFGLDMLDYMGHGNFVDVGIFESIFTILPSEWKNGSPYHHIHKDDIKYYTIIGGKTMDEVKKCSVQFHERSRFVGNLSHLHVVKWRTHIPMLNLFCNKRNNELKKILVYIGVK